MSFTTEPRRSSVFSFELTPSGFGVGIHSSKMQFTELCPYKEKKWKSSVSVRLQHAQFTPVILTVHSFYHRAVQV